MEDQIAKERGREEVSGGRMDGGKSDSKEVGKRLKEGEEGREREGRRDGRKKREGSNSVDGRDKL